MHWHELQQQHNMDRGSVRAHHLVTPKTCEGFEVHAGLTRQGGRGAARGGGGHRGLRGLFNLVEGPGR